MEIEKVYLNIKLTLEEAVILKSLIDSVSGTGSTRNTVNHISDTLEIAGIPVNFTLSETIFRGELIAIDPKMGNNDRTTRKIY